MQQKEETKKKYHNLWTRKQWRASQSQKYFKADGQIFTLLSIYFEMMIDYYYVIQRAIKKRTHTQKSAKPQLKED
jgi:hypothetical protein